MIRARDIVIQSFGILKRDIKIWLGFVFCEVAVTLLGYSLKMGSSILSFFVDKGFQVFVVGTILLFLFGILSLLSIWVNISLIRVVAKRIRGEEMKTFVAEMRDSFHFVARILGAIILFDLFVFLPIFVSLFGFSAVLFGGLFFAKDFGSLGTSIFALLAFYGVFHAFYFSIKYGFALFAIMVDATHIREGFHKSSELVKHRFVDVCMRIVGPLFLYLCIFFGLGSFLDFLVKSVNNVVVTFFIDGISLFLNGFFPILAAALFLLVYNDLKGSPVSVVEVVKK
jgi:hypothetical protein